VHNSLILAIVIVTALGFDFTNGFHDTANAVAPTIATRAMPPRVAVAMSGALNLVGAFLSLKVAATIASHIVNPAYVTLPVIFGGLVGAIFWNVTTWFLRVPSSSSHALIGGVVGAMLVHAGSQAVYWHGIISLVVAPGIAAPIIALVVAGTALLLARLILRGTDRRSLDAGTRVGQIGSSALLSIAHGTNDAQKTMGIITLALIANGSLSASSSTPTWVVIVCGLAIAGGTYVGGWRIIRTMGHGVTHLSATQGFSSQIASSTVILSSSHFGLPLSTTYVATGSIVGSGLGAPPHLVRWRLLGRVGTAWIVTLPAAGICGALAFGLESIFNETAGVFVTGLALIGYCVAVFARSRRGAVTPDNVNDPWEPRVAGEESLPPLSSEVA